MGPSGRIEQGEDGHTLPDTTYGHRQDNSRVEVELGVLDAADEHDRFSADAGLLKETVVKRRSWHRRDMIANVFNYPAASRELRSTAWLDGLRGLAAFEVFLFHYLDFWPVNKAGVWGVDESGVLYMPFVRTLLFSGDTAVCMFFAISGYVLSHRLLSLIQQRKQDNLLPILSSALFRRAVRLYLPVLVQSLILMLLARLLRFPKPEPYESAETFWLEIRNWFLSFIRLLMPLRFPERFEQLNNSYDGGISWTIPLEYYGSLQIYLAVLALAYVGNIGVRRALISVWILISVMRDDWVAGQFLLGMVLADYQLAQQHNTSSTPSSRWARWKPIYLTALFLFGLYAAGMPSASYAHQERGNNTMNPRPGYNWMTLPHAFADWYLDFQVDRMMRCLAAWICLIAVGESPVLRKCAEWRFVQYLGRISFGLYMCHIWVRPCLEPLAVLSCWLLGIDAEAKTGALVPLAWLLYIVPSAAINFIVAGLFERFLDKPSIEAGKRLEKYALSAQ